MSDLPPESESGTETEHSSVDIADPEQTVKAPPISREHLRLAKQSKKMRLRFVIYAGFIWAPYAVSLFLPVIEGSEMTGWFALSSGWMSPLVVPWSANWVLLWGWFALRKRKYSRAKNLGYLATALALTTIALFAKGQDELGSGYTLWLISCVALTAIASFECMRESNEWA
ncbi:MAG: hypothetical protein IH944_01110 [Armatimonadetes bacterium]|nr:hypothetical protein [Armatimonadota bacterium]